MAASYEPEPRHARTCKYVNIDIASALDAVEGDGRTLPQGLVGSIGFEISCQPILGVLLGGRLCVLEVMQVRLDVRKVVFEFLRQVFRVPNPAAGLAGACRLVMPQLAVQRFDELYTFAQ